MKLRIIHVDKWFHVKNDLIKKSDCENGFSTNENENFVSWRKIKSFCEDHKGNPICSHLITVNKFHGKFHSFIHHPCLEEASFQSLFVKQLLLKWILIITRWKLWRILFPPSNFSANASAFWKLRQTFDHPFSSENQQQINKLVKFFVLFDQKFAIECFAARCCFSCEIIF